MSVRTERLVAASLWAVTLCVVGVFVAIVLDLAVQGVHSIGAGYLTDAPREAGRAGGIGTVLVGTLWILAVALATAVPVGLGAALYLTEVSRLPRFTRVVRMSLDVLAGVPSIVFGLFGLAFFVDLLGLGWSIAAGGLTLGCMVLPLFVRAAEEGLRAVSASQRAGAAALGLSHGATLWHVVLPQAAPGLTAALVLSLGRALAETAAAMFTAGAAVRMPSSLSDSARTLAYHVYILAVEVPGGMPRACAAALVLVAVVLAVNLLARALLDAALGRSVS